MARGYERWTAVALLALVAGVLCLSALGVLLITGTASK
jgi:hypothetical protein